MKSQRSQLAALIAIVLAFSASQVSAQCRHTNPVYGQPIYTQPVYSPPVQTYPVYGTPVYGSPHTIVEPVVEVVRKPTPVDVARGYTQEAKLMFQRGDYQAAQEKLGEVIKLAPKDSDAFQFRSLAAFASAKFDDAAADAYDSLRLGKTWTRPVVKSLYNQDLRQYQTHLANLKRANQQEPTMHGHFLLAYHHLVNEQWAQGKVQLEKVLEIQAEEPVSTQLLAAVNQKLAAGEQVVAGQ